MAKLYVIGPYPNDPIKSGQDSSKTAPEHKLGEPSVNDGQTECISKAFFKGDFAPPPGYSVISKADARERRKQWDAEIFARHGEP